MKGPSRNPWPTSSKISGTLGEVHPLNSLRHSTLGSKQCFSPPQRRLAEVRAGLESLGKFGGYECSPTNRMPCFTRSTTPVSGKPEDLRRDSHSTTLLGLEASATLGSSYCLHFHRLSWTCICLAPTANMDCSYSHAPNMDCAKMVVFFNVSSARVAHCSVYSLGKTQ